MLYLLRLDKGVETFLMAECQYRLRQANNPDVSFRETYAFGTSPRNIKIESWWNTLASGQTEQWVKYFEGLKGEGLFDGSWVDKTAIRYCFLEEIRRQVNEFVVTHHLHKIRKQRSRESYLPVGKPDQLFNYPGEGVENFGQPADPDLLAELKKEVEDFDHEAYQTPEVEKFCSETLSQAGFPLPSTWKFNANNPIPKQAYIHLRNALWEREKSGPELPKMEKPKGARNWIDERQREREEIQRQIMEEVARLEANPDLNHHDRFDEGEANETERENSIASDRDAD